MLVGKRRSQRGFTLIELLITMAVAIILATIAVPSFLGMMANNRLASDYNEILSGVNFARSEAIKRREDVAFTVEEGAPWEYKVTLESDEDIRIRSSRDARMTVTSSGDVTFNSLGRVASGSNCEGGCLIDINHDVAGCRAVSISRFGRVGRADCAESAEVSTP
ncbi:GspH/FimT family pseudopilin [Halomonas sp. ML-15]|uniref:GspH/FimT family pseudopilin n=1 Tax=Halomonas sp. ML-15 TaxID=2773305 RepID=UPI0017464891|nr:GspH/FimT family pseudopilin [Halomonas sp. ML-15]MBD3897940.1 GspH/FimT family pseudopilin [Halomonas sp. ML-15]